MTMEDIIIRYVNMPHRIRGFTRQDAEGDYNIYINANMSYEIQKKTLAHELQHIHNNDFSNELSITEIEDYI